MKPKKVYLVGPVTGYKFEVVAKWRHDFIVNPPEGMVGIDPLRKRPDLATAGVIASEYPEHRLASKEGILAQNRFDVERSDGILANFTGATRLSLGSVIESAWAYLWRKPTVMVMEEEGNPHDHPWMRGCAQRVVSTIQEGIRELRSEMSALEIVQGCSGMALVELLNIKKGGVVLIDLTDKSAVAIPTIMKLAWANALGKPTIVVIPKDIPKDDLRSHALIRACAHFTPCDLAAAESIMADLQALS